MNPDLWRVVKARFHAAADLEGAERIAYLDRECGVGTDLRLEVEALLAADAEDAILDRPMAEALGEILPSAAKEDVRFGLPGAGGATEAASAVGRRFGPYRVVRELGQGGMAVVYGAVRDDDQFQKQVAIKRIKRGMDTDAVVARFRQERQILANLEHPNIARLLDGGVTDDGLSFLVMELVEGEPVDAYCDRRGLDVPQRLELFRTVCGAVHFAHRSLVVHRDLKPSNILVTPEGVPKLLDFGIAKLLDPAATGVARGAVTAVGQRPMTPRYASPEQIAGGPITTASDVYSLGVLLYELLTGRPPYGGDDRSPREMERAITEEDPRPPSAVAAEDRSEGRRPVDPELDDVVLMAMHKDPDSRYASAAQLAEDLRRHGAGLPVHARRPTLGYRARKFVLRHRVGVAAAVLVVMSLVGGLVVATWQAGEARAARARTEQERLNAEQVSRFLRELFERSRPDQARGENLSARELLDDGARRVRGDLEAQPLVRAALMDTIGVAYVQLGLYNEAEPLLQGALDIRQEHLPPGHPDLLWTENHWAELLAAQGAYEEAERKMRSALGQVEDFLGQDHDLAAETRENLARALLLQSQLEEAETLLREALDLRWELQPLRQLRGEPPVDVASVLNNLALVLREGSRWREAAGLYRWALHLNRRNLGNDHPDVAVNLNNLAEVLRALGRCDEAVPRYEEALDLHLKLLGDAHPNVADTQNNLAGCLSDPEGYERAEELYRSSLRIRRQAYGGKHPDVAASLSNLGNLMHRRGDLASAEQSYRESLALYRYLHGNEHHLVARLLSNLATVLAAQGNGAAAEAASREALDLHRKIYGDDHSEVLTNRHNLGALLYRFGRFEQAKEQFRAAWGGRDKLLGSENLSVANSRQGLGKALLAQGRCDTAEPHLRSSLEVRRRLGRGGVRLASSEASLGECLLELGRLDEAEAQLRSAHRAWCNDAGKTSEAKAEAVGVLLERLYGRRGEAAVDVTCSSSR